MDKKSKQVIVMRKDLNMRKGKMIAQGAHASLGAVNLIDDDMDNAQQFKARVFNPYAKWMLGNHAKVCVGVDSEEELLAIRDAAMKDNLPVYLVIDSGLTEFNGIPTKTCLAIWPAWDEDIDKITGKLKLL